MSEDFSLIRQLAAEMASNLFYDEIEGITRYHEEIGWHLAALYEVHRAVMGCEYPLANEAILAEVRERLNDVIEAKSYEDARDVILLIDGEENISVLLRWLAETPNFVSFVEEAIEDKLDGDRPRFSRLLYWGNMRFRQEVGLSLLDALRGINQG